MAEEMDFRASMEATYDEMNKERADTSTALPSAEVVETVSSPVETTEAPQEETRARGPDGKFVKTDKVEAPVETEVAPASEPVAQETTDQAVTAGIKPPTSWSPAAKSEFQKLPLAVQEAVAKREMEVSNGFKQYGDKTKAYEALDTVLKPIMPMLQMQGVQPAQYIGNLVQAEAALRGPQKVDAFRYLAQQYGIDLNQLGPSVKPEIDPAIAPVYQELNQLKQTIAYQQQAHQQALNAEIGGELARFAADPKNEFFEQVREDMGALIQSGRATGLADAYEKACRMNGDVFQILNARQIDAATRKIQEGQRKHAQTAQRAVATNVSGTAPTPGIVPDLRSGMAQVYDRLHSRA